MIHPYASAQRRPGPRVPSPLFGQRHILDPAHDVGDAPHGAQERMRGARHRRGQRQGHDVHAGLLWAHRHVPDGIDPQREGVRPPRLPPHPPRVRGHPRGHPREVPLYRHREGGGIRYNQRHEGEGRRHPLGRSGMHNPRLPRRAPVHAPGLGPRREVPRILGIHQVARRDGSGRRDDHRQRRQQVLCPDVRRERGVHPDQATGPARSSNSSETMRASFPWNAMPYSSTRPLSP